MSFCIPFGQILCGTRLFKINIKFYFLRQHEFLSSKKYWEQVNSYTTLTLIILREIFHTVELGCGTVYPQDKIESPQF